MHEEAWRGFKGNAQSLQILSRLEKKVTLTTPDEILQLDDNGADLRCGLNITFRSLASILKYDSVIPVMAGDRPVDKLRLAREPQEDSPPPGRSRLVQLMFVSCLRCPQKRSPLYQA